MGKPSHHKLRKAIVETARAMNAAGINQGTSGNLSARIPEGLLITPTSLPYESMEPEDIVEMRLDGSCEGRRRPSSEWRFHRDLLRVRIDIDVVLHCHATYCTTLAVHERGIPSFHYMTAVAGGSDIRCSAYATFGTQALSDAVIAAIDGRQACLMGHHGLLVATRSLDKALWLAVEVETLAKMYVHALAIGEPPRLDEAEMARVLEQMRRMSYGRAPNDEPTAGTGTI
ncbi:MAG TPA: class II aldolase/adducin family protein [Geminicoccaceae bacterium]|nr:class II aldolase/adducin family protein [Geminicoccus sp.]HMU50138.1 class II aldolase/adducin family protein [Geminicoccaceae bacterium]